jgi:hypothetical protein
MVFVSFVPAGQGQVDQLAEGGGRGKVGNGNGNRIRIRIRKRMIPSRGAEEAIHIPTHDPRPWCQKVGGLVGC